MNQDELIKELQKLLQAKTIDYRAVQSLSTQLSKLDPKFQRFIIDAKTLIHLGRDSIKDHTTALIELVKNCYDADALNVEIEVLSREGRDLIRVADNGFGMSKEELLNNWLRIGFSSKRLSKMSILGRRKTGEKGIGRISTDRLGAHLELITKTEAGNLSGLRVNWDEFDTDGKDVSDINVEITEPSEINLPSKNGMVSPSGTEIKITKLRQQWTDTNIENLYYELSALTPPFNEVTDFIVKLNNDVSDEFSKEVDSGFFKAAEIDFIATYDGVDSKIKYQIKDKYSDKEIRGSIESDQLLSDLHKMDLSYYPKSGLSLGPVTVRLLFFLRDSSSIIGTNFKLADLRSFLDNNAGIKIYRDNFAVRPYGFEHSQFGLDWLELGDRKARNPAGIGRGEEYMVNPNQLVGAVFITRDKNPSLTDSASREGLVENEAFDELASLVEGAIVLLESHRAKLFSQQEKVKRDRAISSHKDIDKIQKDLFGVRDNLATLKDEVIMQGDTIDPHSVLKPLEKTIGKVEIISENFGNTITEMLNWQRVLGGLATVGISSAVFGHETEGSIGGVKSSIMTANLNLTLDPPRITKAVRELEKALKHSKKVAAWGAYALTRVQREKRQKRLIPVRKTIESVVEELKPAFTASSIDISVEGENLFSKTYQMDLESILVNLLTNAYTACALKPSKRKVEVRIQTEDKPNSRGYCVYVSDSGPGIAREFAHRIFEPLFSTKTRATGKSKSVGTGLGLTIVKSIVEDLRGEITFGRDPKLNGARFKIWLPKEE